jgi:seryl-tRNA synthetase
VLLRSHRIITKKWRFAKMDYESEINDLKKRLTKLEKSLDESKAELKSLLDQIRFENDRRDTESLSLR